MIPIAPIAASVIGSLAEAAVTSLAPAAPAAASGPAEASFGEVLQGFAAKTLDSVRTGEAAAIAGVEGKASAQQVVSAVMQAERDLQTAIALRDKAVAAYQEISRMAI